MKSLNFCICCFSCLMYKTWMSTLSSKPWLKPPRPVINVGDVVVLEDPLDSYKLVVRKLAAVEGYEMASTDEDDEPFALGEDQAWVISANLSLTEEVYFHFPISYLFHPLSKVVSKK